MIKRLFFSALLAVSLGLSACAEIPAEAVEANQQVSVGIKTLQDNGLALISAWENTGYMVLDSKFDDVYARADKIYRTKKSVAAGTALTAEQQRDVAGLATLIRDEVRKKVAAQAAEFRQIVKENANTTLNAKRFVTIILQTLAAKAAYPSCRLVINGCNHGW